MNESVRKQLSDLFISAGNNLLEKAKEIINGPCPKISNYKFSFDITVDDDNNVKMTSVVMEE